MHRIVLFSYLLLAACNDGSVFTHSIKDTYVNPLTEIKANLAFTCVHENIPEPTVEADVLFQYARWLQKNNQLKQHTSVNSEIERLYRIASENDHYKANINLQNGAMSGDFRLRDDEHLRMGQQLIDAGVATGYYLVGTFLEEGLAGLKQDTEMALRYFRKAADQGNPQAQYYVGDKLEPINIAPKIAMQMYRCAAEQGNGEAATALGVYLSEIGQYQETLEAFQLGVAAGDESSASFLSKGFLGPQPDDWLYYLGQQEDLERAERYKKIWRILANYSYANPTVPEINEILPLPPAQLPPWNGKLQWLEARLANVPPQKPNEALIHQLAEAKSLDPATGRPLPDSPAFIQATYPWPTCQSGLACPQNGYWKAEPFYQSRARFEGTSIRRFKQGEMMPTQEVTRYQTRFLFSDRITTQVENVSWRLFGEA
ncbi:SEL1-like repeat protein [Pseudomonas silesiensis]|uniref:SEL1-like repeat protein n=1 Tax=Pseudomonas silesiensis TaxID=1853130 RepID=UPI0034D4E592